MFLQHLPSLSLLQNFPELWLGILNFMDKYLRLDNSDLLVSKPITGVYWNAVNL